MEGQDISNETLLLMAKVPDRVHSGSPVFQSLCVTCHLADASGDVGPNLTDDYWLHGGQPMDILKTVTEGVPDKGMVAWMPKIGPQRVQDVVSYILTIRGSNLPGKAPQGELDDGSGSTL
jgi:cytochrome c oxidase cbb3-type subunit 3